MPFLRVRQAEGAREARSGCFSTRFRKENPDEVRDDSFLLFHICL
jgi:hypothetical protein